MLNIFAAGFATSSAIDDILQGRFWWAAVNTALAALNLWVAGKYRSTTKEKYD